VTPNNGNTLSQTISFAFSDAGGAAVITSVQVDINATLVVSNACYIHYAQGLNQLSLANDAGILQGALTPGVAGTLQNSQCSVNAGTSSVVASGTTLTLNLALTFASGFAGTKNIYMDSAANTLDSGWVLLGQWLVP
jgi:trimeric autotransporter adhesin